MAPPALPLLALLALLVALGVAPARGWGEDVPVEVLSVANGGPWGEWGDPEFCPRGSYAVGVQLKVEAHRGFFGDDSGLNGVKLFCDPPGTASSSVGPRGSWLPSQTCPQRQPLVAFRLRVEPPQGVWDDVAASNLDAMCGDGTVLLGQGTLAGTWGNWSLSCSTSWRVCGIRTLLEPPQRAGDDTGLNNLQMFCCP